LKAPFCEKIKNILADYFWRKYYENMASTQREIQAKVHISAANLYSPFRATYIHLHPYICLSWRLFCA
jgi:hypothetical protein